MGNVVNLGLKFISKNLLFSDICVNTHTHTHTNTQTQPPATPSRPLVNKFVKLKFAKIHFFFNDSPRRCHWAELINDFQPFANLWQAESPTYFNPTASPREMRSPPQSPSLCENHFCCI